MTSETKIILLASSDSDSPSLIPSEPAPVLLDYRSERAPVSALQDGPVVEVPAWRDILELGKPEISLLVVISALAGFTLGAGQSFDFGVLIAALTGIGLTSGGAGSLNHYFERHLDGMMRRTAARPLPSGRLRPVASLLFAFCSITLGLTVLFAFVNALTTVLAAVAIVLYVFVYTPLKRTTKYNTLIGAIPGALPALGGWTAATDSLGAGGWALFAILFVWQIPHFLSLAWMYRADYARAGFAMLPVVEPSGNSTAWQTLAFTVLLLPVGLLPVLLGLGGIVYAASAMLLAVMFIRQSFRFYKDRTSAKARMVLVASILYIPLLLGGIFLDRIIPL